MKIGFCPLYKKEMELCASHIVPKFVYDSLKWNNNSRFIIYDENTPPLQSGYKMYLLSKEAEVLFSKDEKWFRDKIYLPIKSDNFPSLLEYDEHLYRFLVLQLWRYCIADMHDESFELYDENIYPRLLFALEEWRLFLKDGILPICYSKFFLMPLADSLYKYQHTKEPTLYIRRVNEFNIMLGHNGEIVLYCKFPSLVIWAPLTYVDEPYGLEVHPNGGTLNFDQTFFPSESQVYIEHCIERNIYNRIERGLSKSDEYFRKQQERMDKDPEYQVSELCKILDLPDSF